MNGEVLTGSLLPSAKSHCLGKHVIARTRRYKRRCLRLFLDLTQTLISTSFLPLPSLATTPSYNLLPAAFFHNNTNNLKQYLYVPLGLALGLTSLLTLSEHNNMAHPSQTKPPTAIEREIPRNRPRSDENRLVAFYEDNGRTFVLPSKTMV